MIEKKEASANPTEFVAVYITVDNEDGAVHIATALVIEKLIACANVKTGARSIFRANGIVQLENEVIVIMKTTRENVDAVVARVKELHSYEVPCITVMPIIAGNPDFLEWVDLQTL